MGSNNKMKTVFVFLTILAYALAAVHYVPCGHSFTIAPKKVHASASASKCISHKAHHYFFGCKGGNKIVNPIVGPIVGPVVGPVVDPIVGRPQLPVGGGRQIVDPIIGGLPNFQ